MPSRCLSSFTLAGPVAFVVNYEVASNESIVHCLRKMDSFILYFEFASHVSYALVMC
jgi:hypothetical protein